MGQILSEEKYNNKPLVSVIIPAYNIEKYIKKCVESVIGQNYNNLEIILVDDGSTDGTPDICDFYAQKDRRVKVLHQQNGGLSKARNVGIETSSAQYLFFVDGDDMIHKDCINNMYRIMELEKSDIIQCKTFSFLNEDKVPTELPDETYKIYNGKEMCRYLVFGTLGSDTTVVWNKLYKKELFEKIRFQEGMLYEDVAVMHELLWNAKRIAVTNQPLSFYRSKRPGSITHSGNKKYEDAIKADLMRVKFFRQHQEDMLLGQSLYILSNDMARLRIYKKNTGDVIRQEHKEAIRAAKDRGISVPKKILITFGYLWPMGWFFLWKLRMDIKGKIEWLKKGEWV